MKNKFWKSFRVKILAYSLVSLILALLTVALVALLFLNSIKGAFHSDKATPQNGRHELELTTEHVVENEEIWEKNKEKQVTPEEASFVMEITQAIVYLQHNLPVFVLAILLLLVVGSGTFLLYFQMFTRNMTSYLKRVSDGIDDIASGNFHEEIPVIGEDEFANIAEKLNCMTGEIRLLIESERNYEQEKDALITNVAHDLRTPLTSVIGYLDLVRKRNELKDEERTRYISIAYDKALRLEKLIEDLFEFTKVGAERIQVHLAEIDFGRFIEQMVEEFYPSFEAADLVCDLDIQVEEGKIQADGDLLARGISNLFSNAVKYGRDGKIIKVKVKEDVEKQEMKLEIINFGQIISPEDLEHIFDKFFRGESSRSTETGGSGLGLAIAKKVVLLHHGKIAVSSDYKGTVFWIALPLNGQQETEKKEEGKMCEMDTCTPFQQITDSRE